MIKSSKCINIDWLECHCLEPIKPRDAEYFRSLGFDVVERDYGTRVYEQMFTLFLEDGQPFLEVRRQPHKTNDKNKYQVLEDGSCHLRLHNRACYFNDAGSIMQTFIKTHGYTFRRISRIDLCLDFERFDSGDLPAKFVARYFKGRYAKVNQCSISAHGQDMWDGQQWNSVSWGSKKSPVFTRLYNKSLELRQCKDKPYIRQAWASCGLVDDFIQLTKTNRDGSTYKPEIWRLEFAITSEVKNWVCFDVDEEGNNTHYSVRNNLSRYANREAILTMFASLTARYFHFKKVEEKGRISPALSAIRTEVNWLNREKSMQRKDRCKDKVLFDFHCAESYKVEKVAAAKGDNKALLALRRRVEYYKLTHISEKVREACDAIIQSIDRELLSSSAAQPHDEKELLLLQRLTALQIGKKGCVDIAAEKEFIRSIVELGDSLF